jgi:outer membrane beta-barrel protein
MPRRLLAALLFAATASTAQAQTSPPANEPVVVPQVDRRDVKRPRFPSNDFEIGLFAGTYATQNFGSSGVSGVRLGYHITEDVFVEGAYGQSKVSDEAFRQVLPGGVFVNQTENLTYYNVSFGYNVMPGEVFFGRNVAKASAFYLIGGVGSTKFVDQKKQTINVGFGTRLIFADWFAAQVDVRNHMFSLDLLGKKQNTQNLEVTLGATFFF